MEIVRVKFARKPRNLTEVSLYSPSEKAEVCIVQETFEMTDAEYDQFDQTLSYAREFLMDYGGRDMEGRAKVVCIKAPNRKAFYINPEGYFYPRYVGFAVE